MAIYAIGDLHLDGGQGKPMDVFGPHWENHAQRIAANWDAAVGDEDTVLVAGDISWAMKLPDALPDLDYLAQRPGKKLVVRGNHDYWWKRESVNKIQRLIDSSITLLQGTCVTAEGAAVAGTRGWRLEGEESEPDTRILQRELGLLERALIAMPEGMTRIALLHFPPFDVDLQPTEFAELLTRFRVDIVVYGHIHGGGYLEGDIGGTRHVLASADHVGFAPVRIRGS